jgi:taurine dioxygenase
MIELERLEGAFGVAVRGVDLKGGIDDVEMRALVDAVYEHRLIVIKDQDCCKDDYLAFGHRWGVPIPHVLDHMRMPGYPELLAVGNTEEKDKADKIRNGAVLWHTDQSYEAEPASATMLYSRIVPKTGGQTMLCDMVAAYDALDDAMKGRIDGLSAAHLYGAGPRLASEIPANPLVGDGQKDRVPACHHPLVRRHPITGAKGLYAVGHSAFGLAGMPDDEAEALILELKQHCARPEFVYHQAYDVGDIALYDTLSTMHSAIPIDAADSEDDDNARLLWRISVRGTPDVYASRAA